MDFLANLENKRIHLCSIPTSDYEAGFAIITDKT